MVKPNNKNDIADKMADQYSQLGLALVFLRNFLPFERSFISTSHLEFERERSSRDKAELNCVDHINEGNSRFTVVLEKIFLDDLRVWIKPFRYESENSLICFHRREQLPASRTIIQRRFEDAKKLKNLSSVPYCSMVLTTSLSFALPLLA